MSTREGNATNGYTLIYRNNGDGNFTDIGVQLPGLWYNYPPERFTWGDYDRDGDLDLLSDDCSIMYRNNCSVSNRPPTSPGGIMASLQKNNEVHLTWSHSIDGETSSSGGLTYNLRMGTSPNGIDIITPHANVTTGQRRLAASGPITSNAWQMVDLPKGTYYWSVQAIDPGFAGSLFATEMSFVITNSRPKLSSFLNYTNSHIMPVIPVNFTTSDEETAASNLIVSVFSSNTNVIPDNHLELSGSGTNRILNIHPVINQPGIADIRVTSEDAAGAFAERVFKISITNGLPTLSAIPNLTVPVNTPTNIIFTVSDAETQLSELVLAAISSNTNLIPKQNIAFSGLGTSRTLQITPSLYQSGSATIQLTINDSSGGFANRSFIVTVQAFTDIPTGLPGVTNGGVAWGDFDNDQDLDLLIVGSGLARVYRNNANGSFTDIGLGLPAVANGGCAWGDWNNDGYLDFILTGSGFTRLYRNNGNGTFINIPNNLPGLYFSAVAWGDYNNNGTLDLALCGSTNNLPANSITRIYRNNLDGTFTDAQTGLPGISQGSIVWGDYDNDSDLDLLLAGFSGVLQTNITRIYRNDGGGMFVNTTTNLLGIKSGNAAWADFDSDGDLDPALTGQGNLPSQANVLRVYQNQGSGFFQDLNISSEAISLGSVAWADVDNDGRSDLIATGIQPVYPNGSFTRIYRYTATGTFSSYTNSLLGFARGTQAPADYDNDGDLDFVMLGVTASFGQPVAKLYRNNFAFTNTPPSACSNLVATPDAKGVVLTWQPATDKETTNSSALTYSVRVGTNSGGDQILSASADLATGWRRIPSRGFANSNSWMLQSIPPGNYFWSVQAVDSSFAGSAFAQEGTFAIPAYSTIYIKGAAMLGSGRFRVTFNGSADVAYDLLVSSDLVTWEWAGTATEIEPGCFDFTDVTATEGSRFYRVSGQ